MPSSQPLCGAFGLYSKESLKGKRSVSHVQRAILGLDHRTYITTAMRKRKENERHTMYSCSTALE